MRLEDGEVALRRPTEEDIPAIVEACRDPEIPRWTQVPSPYTEDDARAFLRVAPDALAIVDAGTGEFLGTISWRWVDGNVQLGYWVKREARGRSVATRALRLLSQWAFEELRADRVQRSRSRRTVRPSASPRRPASDGRRCFACSSR